MEKSTNGPILYFDGVCNLCNSTIDFFISQDSREIFRYAPLQSKSALKNLEKKYTNDLDTVVLFYNGKLYSKSQAILKALVILGAPYSISIILQVIPRFISDSIYSIIAKNRYKLFGQKKTCRLPTAREKKLFLN